MRSCDVGPCEDEAIVTFIGESDRSWRKAHSCAEHAQMLADYCSKPVERWHEDLIPIAQFDHATREWVPV